MRSYKGWLVSLPMVFLAVSARAVGITYNTVASGDWNVDATWDENGIPVYKGDETDKINSHTVTNAADELETYQLYVGVASAGQHSTLVKKGGTYTSQYLLEVGTKQASSADFVLDGAAGYFTTYRWVVGRKGGDAHVRVKDGSLTTSAALLMGVETPVTRKANTIELVNSAWTNSGAFGMGYTSTVTNEIRLVRSVLFSSTDLTLGNGTVEGNTSDVGHCFLIAEDVSKVEAPNKSLYMPNNAYQSAHLIVSNSLLDVNWLAMGYKAGTTNSLVLIDSAFTNRSTTLNASIGHEADTLSRILLKDLKKEKQSASDVFGRLAFKSDEGKRRAFDVEIVGGDWTSSADFTACQAYNWRRFTFRDLALPMRNISAGNVCATGETELILSNCTGVATHLTVANGAGTSGTVELYDSVLTNLSQCIVSDMSGSAPDHSVGGNLLLSGGTYAFSSELRVRAGTGRIVMERGAKATVNVLYVPNLTGASAHLEVADGSELLVTNNFCIGNQNQTSCEVFVHDGGKIRVLQTAAKFAFGTAPAAFTFTISGEDSEVRFPGRSTAFATTAGTTGTLNLNGGLFETKTFGSPAETANQIINFNGGTVKASESATLTQSYSKDYVDVGGAVFETSGEGHAVNLYGTLQHKGDSAVMDGGLTKQGPGTLNLCATNTFNGPVVVREGTLVSACINGAALPDGVSVALDLVRGASLDRTNQGAYPAHMTISVANAAALDPEKKYKLAGNWDPACEVTFDLPQGWKAYQKGGDLMVKFDKGIILIVR